MASTDIGMRVDEIVPDTATHLGHILVNPCGEVLVHRPDKPKLGVTAALPRLGRLPGERPYATLSRLWQERMGVTPDGVFPIRHLWTTPHSRSYYFAGSTTDIRPEPKHECGWADPGHARELLAASAPGPGRDRDLSALDAALGMCLSPYRRVLETVRELHRMGYEQIRACPYLYALGTWRCPIVPASWTLREHGGLFRYPWSGSQTPFPNTEQHHTTYTSANGQGDLFDNFVVPGVEFATPRELAEAFVRERPLVSFAGCGPDPEYARWLDAVLNTAVPVGVFYAFAEYEPPCDHLYTAHTECRTLPLPPPGPYHQRVWDEYAKS